ncbi:MAG: hypothetical protein HQL56_12165 [Magnetococcales bacterium]|nr:hypothetical protein [Magnetococcales bacterium]
MKSLLDSEKIDLPDKVTLSRRVPLSDRKQVAEQIAEQLLRKEPEKQPDGRHPGTGAAARPQRDLAQSAIHRSLEAIQQSAVAERLESVVPLLEAIRLYLPTGKEERDMPAGALSLQAWMALLNRWELHLAKTRKSQLGFIRTFLEEALARLERVQSPLGNILGGLMGVVDQYVKLNQDRREEAA